MFFDKALKSKQYSWLAMKTIFIEARYKGKINLSALDKQEIKKLPKTIALFTTVQYLNFIPEIKNHLEKVGREVKLFRPTKSKYPSQILGCSIEEYGGNELKGIDAFLYVGDGMFHPAALAIRNKLPVFIFNPLSGKLAELNKSQLDKIEKQKKGALLRFHSSVDIGILISTKPGQYNIRLAKQIKKKFPGKNFYMLAFDTLDLTQLANFPFIECFVNTACPRIGYDDYINFPKPVVADCHTLLH